MDDEASIRALHAEHGGFLLRHALYLTAGNRHRSEELVHETIVRAWRQAAARTGKPPARPWLLTVARNLAAGDWQARPQRQADAPLSTEDAHPHPGLVGRRRRAGRDASPRPQDHRRDVLPWTSRREGGGHTRDPHGHSEAPYVLRAQGTETSSAGPWPGPLTSRQLAFRRKRVGSRVPGSMPKAGNVRGARSAAPGCPPGGWCQPCWPVTVPAPWRLMPARRGV